MFSLTARLTELGPWWLGLALIALDATAIVRALIRGHGVASTLAWVFAIVAFPGLGAAAYLLLANPSVRRTVRRKAAALGRTAEDALTDAFANQGERQIARLACELTCLRASAKNAVELLVEDEKAFGQIEHDLASAKDSIWAEYYIVKNDETGHRFLDALCARAQAGVKVRLLYDGLGSLGLDGARLKAIRAAGGKVEPFLPLNPLRRRWAVHLRNHRKMIVIDGDVAFTGGMNVGDEYSGRSRRKGNQPTCGSAGPRSGTSRPCSPTTGSSPPTSPCLFRKGMANGRATPWSVPCRVDRTSRTMPAPIPFSRGSWQPGSNAS